MGTGKAGTNPRTRIPLVEQTIQACDRSMEQGFGDEDISSLYRLKRHGRTRPAGSSGK